jgi:hypothetical protein
VGSGYIGTPNVGWIALNDAGNTLAVGGINDNGGIGATWVFTRSGSVWTQQGLKLIGTGAVGNATQGSGLSLSSSGDTLVIGGPDDNGGIGAVWVFTRSNGVWSQLGSKLVGTGYVGTPRFGFDIDLNANGDRMAVVGINDDGNIGAVWIFELINGSWIQVGNKLVGRDYVGTPGAESCTLNANGDILYFTGFQDNGGIGAVWVFTRDPSGGWNQRGSKLTVTGNIGNANLQVISTDASGAIFAVGGVGDDGGMGATWVFD